jgi:DNA replication protein DnaC
MNHLSNIQNLLKNTISVSDNRCPACKRKFMIKDGEEYCFHCTEIAPEDNKVSEEVGAWIANREVDELATAFKKKSLMNKDLEDATLSSYLPQNETQKQALKQAYEYVDSFDKVHGMFLQGRPGIGKSHLAASIVKELIQKKHTGIFISLPRLMTELKATYDKNSDLKEADLLAALQKVDLLVMDDLGVERNGKGQATAWAQSKIYEIVDSRIGKATIYTTNFSANELLDMYGERDFSRMVQDCTSVKMAGDNYRFRNFK